MQTAKTSYSLALRVGAFLALLFTVHVPQVDAQTNRAGNPTQFSVGFRAMGWSGAAEDLYIMEGQTKKSFIATDANPSMRIDYRGPSPLLIYKEGETVLNADGVPIPRPVGRFNITKSGDWLLVLEAAEDASDRLVYEVFPVADDPQAIQAGYRIVNFTGAPLAVKINDAQSVIAAREFVHLQPKAREDFSLSVLLAAESEGEWTVQYENLFRDRPGIRTTLFVSKGNDRIRTRKFLDRATPSDL